MLEARYALHRGFDVRQQPVEIAGEELFAELTGDPIGEARGRAPLVGAEDPAHALLAQIVGRVRFAQHGKLTPAAGAGALR